MRGDRVYHVSFESGAAGGWFVKAAGGRKLFGPCATSDEAALHGEERAQASATSTGFGRLVVLDASGWPVTERTYGSDPREPGKPAAAEIL
jgi:hypothetical protein